MGLLSGIGQVLAGGVAGGAKAAGESFVEQAKQQALAAREENMLRIQEKFAKEGRKETQEFQAGERALDRESAQKMADQTQLGANIRQTASLKSAEDLAEVERLSRSEEAGAEREARKTAATDAATTAKNLLTFKNNLPDKEKTAIEKNIEGLSKYIPKEQALAITLASLTKEAKDLEKTQLKSWVDMYIADLKIEGAGGMAPTEQQKIKVGEGVTTRLGYSPTSVMASSISLGAKKTEAPVAPKNTFDAISAVVAGKTAPKANAPAAGADVPAPAVKEKWLDGIYNSLFGGFGKREIELENMKKKGLLE